MKTTTKTNTLRHIPWGKTIEIRDEAGNLALVNPRGNPDLGIPDRSDRDFADRIVQACNSHDELVASLEGLLNGFIHIPGEEKGNKARTLIFTHCENMRKAASRARETLERSKATRRRVPPAEAAHLTP